MANAQLHAGLFPTFLQELLWECLETDIKAMTAPIHKVMFYAQGSQHGAAKAGLLYL